MKKVVAVYEQEEAYGKNLAEYVNRRESVPFEMQVFSQADKLSTYLQSHTPQLLLLSEGSDLKGYGEICDKAEDVVYLTEQKEQIPSCNRDHIYKYQPTDQILSQLMQHISGKEQRDSPILQTSCTIYGVYSPVGRCGKTTFSLLLGELLSRRRSVLYIGFDELSLLDEDALEGNVREEKEDEKKGKAIEERLKERQKEECQKEECHREKGTLSDAYFYSQRHRLREKLPSLVLHWHGIDMLTGMNCPEDLGAISTKEWSMLVQEIAQEAGYAAIVLDMGTRLWLADALFSLCSHLYMPVLAERHARDQRQHFEKWLEKNGAEEIWQRMQIIELPYCAQNGTLKERLEYALWGEAGDYVRSLMPSEW